MTATALVIPCSIPHGSNLNERPMFTSEVPHECEIGRFGDTVNQPLAARRKTRMELQPCVRCNRPLRAPQGINSTGDQAIAIFISAVTVGVRPRLKSRAQRRVICMACAGSISLAPDPNTGAFNSAVYEILCDLSGRDMTIVQAAWAQKTNPRAQLQPMPGSRPDKTLEPMPTVQMPALTAAAG